MGGRGESPATMFIGRSAGKYEGSGTEGGGNRDRARLLRCRVLAVEQGHEREGVVFAIQQDRLPQHAVVMKTVRLVDTAAARIRFEDIQPEAVRAMMLKGA